MVIGHNILKIDKNDSHQYSLNILPNYFDFTKRWTECYAFCISRDKFMFSLITAHFGFLVVKTGLNPSNKIVIN